MSHSHREHQPRHCDYEDYDYRGAFWEGQNREYEDLTERIALRRLLPPTGGRILDVGAGFGRLADLYAGYEEIILLDTAKSLLRQASEHLRDERITYVAGSIFDLPLSDASLDVVLSVRVLHHLADIPLAFREIRRVLRPAGRYILEYANKRNVKAVLRYLLRHGPSPFTHEPYEFLPLHYDFHPEYMEMQLRAAGFEPGQHLAVSTFRLQPLKRLVPARLLATADGWLQRPTARLALAPSVFLQATPCGDSPRHSAAELFRCPACHGRALHQDASALTCESCGRAWPIEEGIHDFTASFPR